MLQGSMSMSSAIDLETRQHSSCAGAAVHACLYTSWYTEMLFARIVCAHEVIIHQYKFDLWKWYQGLDQHSLVTSCCRTRLKRGDAQRKCKQANFSLLLPKKCKSRPQFPFDEHNRWYFGWQEHKKLKSSKRRLLVPGFEKARFSWSCRHRTHCIPHTFQNHDTIVLAMSQRKTKHCPVMTQRKTSSRFLRIWLVGGRISLTYTRNQANIDWS